jgi:hypothetical protein
MHPFRLRLKWEDTQKRIYGTETMKIENSRSGIENREFLKIMEPRHLPSEDEVGTRTEQQWMRTWQPEREMTTKSVRTSQNTKQHAQSQTDREIS